MNTSLFFSPKGRIGPAVFLQSAIILIVIGFVLNMVQIFMPGLILVTTLAGIALLWPWICLWIKRLHDAGKSGWMLLVIILVTIVLSMISSFVVRMFVHVNPADVQAAMKSAHGVMGMIKAGAEANKAILLPNAISTVVVQVLVVFGANTLLKSDPEENQFGPATA